MANATTKFDRFVYFMERTTSEHDNEALVALRKANEMLKEFNFSWTELLTAKKAISDERVIEEKVEEQAKAGDELGRMFDYLLQEVQQGSFRSFIESVHKQYNSRGTLSPKQEKAIRDAYARQQARA